MAVAIQLTLDECSLVDVAVLVHESTLAMCLPLSVEFAFVGTWPFSDCDVCRPYNNKSTIESALELRVKYYLTYQFECLRIAGSQATALFALLLD